MTRRSSPILLLALVALLAFAGGLWQLFTLRFETGDVYPPYSSLRADPLGTKALHDSFDELSILRVDRNYRPLEKLDDPRNTTVFWFGDGYSTVPEAEWRNFVRGGGRLVVAWVPSQFVQRSFTNTAAGPMPWQRQRYRQGPLLPPDPLSQKPEDIAFRENWKLELEFIALPGMGSEFKSDTAMLKADLPLPQEIAWHSTVCFTNLHEDWRTIYERQGRPVMIERSIGEGSVVVSTDAWLASNEAMRRERLPQLLTWLTGGNPRLIFDEQHLGVQEDPGVASLMRRYRMHGIVGAFLVLALLFLWRSGTSFIPRDRPANGHALTADIIGRDAASGFVNLLRRGIKPAELLKICFDEWRNSLAGGDGCSRERLNRMEQIMMSFDDTQPEKRSVVQTYRDLHRAWKAKE